MQLDKIIGTEARDIEYLGLGFLAACYEWKHTNRSTWRHLRGFLQACEFIDYRGYISKTTLFDYMSDKNNELSIGRFFFRDPASKRYALSPAGIQARTDWNTILRRVLLDEKERYRLLYERWNKEEILRRKKLKRFFELAQDEQIRIARAFFAMPRSTHDEKRHVQAARKYLYLNFDVRPNDIKTLASQHAAIRAVKHMPNPPAPPPGAMPGGDLETVFRRPEHYRKAEPDKNS